MYVVAAVALITQNLEETYYTCRARELTSHFSGVRVD